MKDLSLASLIEPHMHGGLDTCIQLTKRMIRIVTHITLSSYEPRRETVWNDNQVGKHLQKKLDRVE